MAAISRKRLIISACVTVIILGLVAKHSIGPVNAIIEQAAKTNSKRDVTDLFVYPGEKYQITQGKVYDCFTGNLRDNYGAINNIFVYNSTNTGTTNAQRQQHFQNIFENQLWMNKTDGGINKNSTDYLASGSGSSLEAGQAPLTLLNSVIDRLKIHLNKPVISIVDVPCGDFHWMKELVGRRQDVLYTGIDIVPTLIERHKKNFVHLTNAKFLHADIVDKELTEPYDIIFSRDMLQHLHTVDAMKVLGHFSSSGSRLLITTQLKGTLNKDIKIPGHYRHLNLMLPPIVLVPPVCEIPDLAHNKVKYLAIWTLPLKQFSKQ